MTCEWEEAMQPYEIRQLRDGSIDYNHYYARPVALLTPAMHRFWRKAAMLKAALVVIAAIAAVTVAESSHRTACTHCATPAVVGE
jgi:hypothetical protein